MMMQPHSHELHAVLIVDDDDSFRGVLKQVLSANGRVNVTACESGEEAIKALQEDQFDVVVLDYKMLGMNGLDVIKWKNDKQIDTPVVMLTAAGTETIAVEAMKLGAYDYVRKEHIDVDHISLLIAGVHERYLFRKEKEQREQIEREREKSLVAVETFHSTLASIAQIVNHSLSLVSLNIKRHETELMPYMNEIGRDQIEKVFGEMNQEYSVIASAVKSMLNMANVLHGNFSEVGYESKLQEALTGKIKDLQKQSGDSVPLKE
ncbi:MAG: response regulator [bacterium]